MIKSKILKKIVFILILCYAIITFFKQQKILNNYKVQSKNLDEQIAIASEKQAKLNEEKKIYKFYFNKNLRALIPE